MDGDMCVYVCIFMETLLVTLLPMRIYRCLCIFTYTHTYIYIDTHTYKYMYTTHTSVAMYYISISHFIYSVVLTTLVCLPCTSELQVADKEDPSRLDAYVKGEKGALSRYFYSDCLWENLYFYLSSLFMIRKRLLFMSILFSSIKS